MCKEVEFVIPPAALSLLGSLNIGSSLPKSASQASLHTSKETQVATFINECTPRLSIKIVIHRCAKWAASIPWKVPPWIQFKWQPGALLPLTRKYPSQTGLQFQPLDYSASLKIHLPRPHAPPHFEEERCHLE